MIIIFSFNNTLRQRAISIVTSVYTEDEKGGTGARIELWKGALLIFHEHPLFGAGTGNFESNIIRLVQEKKLKETPTMVHAHNIYLQALATKGIIGFVILIVLLSVLLHWGMKETQNYGGMGGYIIIFSTVLTMAGGLTEDNIGTTKYLVAYCFTMGLLGPSGLMKENGEKRVMPNDEKS
jgi:O-antigen ligase